MLAGGVFIFSPGEIERLGFPPRKLFAGKKLNSVCSSNTIQNTFNEEEEAGAFERGTHDGLPNINSLHNCREDPIEDEDDGSAAHSGLFSSSGGGASVRVSPEIPPMRP